jgi:hypothetical protein
MRSKRSHNRPAKTMSKDLSSDDNTDYTQR